MGATKPEKIIMMAAKGREDNNVSFKVFNNLIFIFYYYNHDLATLLIYWKNKNIKNPAIPINGIAGLVYISI